MKAVEAQYQRLKTALESLPGEDRKRMRLTDADGLLAKKYHGFNLNHAEIQERASAARKSDSKWDGITSSLVEHVEINDISVKAADGKTIQIPPPAKSFGHLIHVPDFGNVFLAELTVNHNSYNLTMIRLELGCLAAGSAKIASCNVNGKGAGGGGNGIGLAGDGGTPDR
jgi:hypothetical protein